MTPRDLTPADASAFDALRARVVGAHDPARVAWKYARPGALRWGVWSPEGALVGHYGVFPVPLDLAGRAAQAASGADALTDAAWRGRGVYTALSLHANAALAARGDALQIGWLHGGWPGVERRAGWRRLGTLRWRRTRAALLAALRPAPDATAATPEVLDRLWERVEGRWPLTVRRDAAWFAWRTREPGRASEVRVVWRGSEPVGAVAWRVEAGRVARRGVLLDACFAPDDLAAAEALVRVALGALARRGAVSAAALAVPGAAWDRALAACGFGPGEAFAVGVVPYGPLPSAPVEAWALTGAEGDAT